MCQCSAEPQLAYSERSYLCWTVRQICRCNLIEIIAEISAQFVLHLLSCSLLYLSTMIFGAFLEVLIVGSNTAYRHWQLAMMIGNDFPADEASLTCTAARQLSEGERGSSHKSQVSIAPSLLT